MKKIQILWVFEADVFTVQKGFLVYKKTKIDFSRFIFTIYYMGIHRVTRGYGGLWGVTRGDKGLQGVTRQTCFLIRTSTDSFSLSILHKNQG